MFNLVEMSLDYQLLSEQIPQVYQRIAPYIHKTPVLSSEQLDQLTGMKIFLKCENLQKVGAFKFRGASNAILQLKENFGNQEIPVTDVCTHSSGNHAQALAKAAKNFGFNAHIVMPKNAPLVKVNAVRDSYGAKVYFCEPNQQAREETCEKIQQDIPGCEFIHPYNDTRIILGQGTCLYEFYNQMKERQAEESQSQNNDLVLDAVLCPIGGGGLMSGTCLSVRLLTNQKLTIYGVEPEKANDAQRSLESGQHLKNESPPQTIGDGLLTNLGSLTYPIIRDHVKKVYTASDEEAIKAMKFVWERMKIIIEPSSAFAVAVAMFNKEFQELHKGERVGIIISGGNVDIKKISSEIF